MEDIVIAGLVRTPIGRFMGGLSTTPAPQLGAVAIRAAVERTGIDPSLITSVVIGNAIAAGLGQCPARQAAISGGVPVTASALTVNKVCASAMQAVIIGAQSIRDGDENVVVAGGMEVMSAGPHYLPHSREGFRLGNFDLVDATVHDGLWCPFENKHMGLSAEVIAEKYGITRQDCDDYAVESHRRSLAAWAAGAFRDEVVPVEVRQKKGSVFVEVDECPRADTTIENLRRLKPVFKEDGVITAGNAPGITDGAAAMLVLSAATAERLNVTPLARVTGYASVGNEPKWLFDAPALCIQKLLDRTTTALDDYDLIEVNEAFPSQVLANGRVLDWNWAKVNVNGGALALGHPIGASGARIIVTLVHALRARGLKRGIAALCHGGGGAVALAVEVV